MGDAHAHSALGAALTALTRGFAALHTVALIVVCMMALSVGIAFWEAQLPAIVQTFFSRDTDRYAALSGVCPSRA